MRILTTDQWGARPPKSAIQKVGTPSRIIIHHTDGHAGGKTLDDAKAYARTIQADHMGRGWVDSGHNFLVCRNGTVLEGRTGTVAAINGRRMVVSAHCPGQNEQPGIEHEHIPGEPMTKPQKQASVDLCVWICQKTGIAVTAFYPHKQFFATACPDNLVDWIPELSRRVAAELRADPPTTPSGPADHAAEVLWRQWAFGEGKFKGHDPFEGTRPEVVDPVPREWFVRAIKFLKAREK